MLGHIAEHIAGRVFDIQLHERADYPGSDGYFRSGPFRGRSVDVKARSRREGFLNIREDHLPDFFLVMTGPRQRRAALRQSLNRGASRRSICSRPGRWSRTSKPVP